MVHRPGRVNLTMPLPDGRTLVSLCDAASYGASEKGSGAPRMAGSDRGTDAGGRSRQTDDVRADRRHESARRGHVREPA